MTNLDHVYFEAADPPRRVLPNRFAPRCVRQPIPLRIVRPRSSENDTVDPFISWLLREAGVTVDAYRASALGRRLPACLRALRAASPAAARAILEQQPDRRRKAVSTVLIGVSGFFRDPQVWLHLQTAVLPGLLARRRSLRVLSAGCADGQELYSMAILLDELGALEGSVLLGEDCRPDAIARAGAGVYQASDMGEVPDARKQRYFAQDGSWHRVVPRLRERAGWVARDLFGPGRPGNWDIVLFRNVAIYMKTSQAVLLWTRLCGEMAPGAVLVTGKAERPPADLPLMRLSTCVYRKTDG